MNAALSVTTHTPCSPSFSWPLIELVLASESAFLAVPSVICGQVVENGCRDVLSTKSIALPAMVSFLANGCATVTTIWDPLPHPTHLMQKRLPNDESPQKSEKRSLRVWGNEVPGHTFQVEWCRSLSCVREVMSNNQPHFSTVCTTTCSPNPAVLAASPWQIK